jgi:hypothetical protein
VFGINRKKELHRLFSLLKEIIAFFLKNIWPISFLTLSIEFPYILIQNFEHFTELPPILSFWLSMIVLAAIFIIYPLSTGAQISLYYQIINNNDLDFRKCISESKGVLANLVLGTLIYLVLTILGLAAFIIPGIIIGIRLSFYCFLIVYENYPPIYALKESYRITAGHTWQIANPFLVISIPAIAASFLIQEYFMAVNLYNIFSGVIIDTIASILGWLNLILLFRFYCLYKVKGALN